MRRVLSLVFLAVGIGSSAIALAQTPAPNFPTKPIRFVVGYPPGGTADLLAREIGLGLTQKFGQPVVIDNKPGANGNLAADIVAKSAPDGYTLLMSAPGPLAVNESLFKSQPFDAHTAFAPVSLAGVAPLVLVVNSNLPVKTLPELLAYVKANPDKSTYSSQGNASSGHLAMELLKSRTGIPGTHVPFNGSAPALNAVLAGHVLMMFDNAASSLPHVKSGALRAIAVAEADRIVGDPSIPTVAEQGVPGFVATPWFGVATVAGTPPAVVNALSLAMRETLNAPATKKKFLDGGVEVRPNTPQQFETYIKAENVKWKEVIKTSGARLD